MSRINVANFRHPDGTDDNITLDSSGQVGLGTSSPQSLLHLSGTVPDIRYTDTTGDEYRVGNNNGVFRVYNTTDTTTPFAITGAGAVGIGTTSPGSALEVSTASNTGVTIRSGSTTDNGFINFTDGAVKGQILYDHNGDYMRFFANGAEAARIDSSGRLLVGTSSDDGRVSLFQIAGNTGGNTGAQISLNRGAIPTAVNQTIGLINFGDGSGDKYAEIKSQCDGAAAAGDAPGRLVFSTTADGASSPTGRMQIDRRGQSLFLSDGTPSVDNMCSTVAGASSSALVSFRNNATFGSLGSGSEVCRIARDGDLTNANNSYLGLSDIKLKENIVNANSQWDDLKALQVRNYNLKEGQTHTQIGLVAQEVELVSPGLVSESPDRDEDGNDLGTVTKSVNYSVLYMKAVKALQEAMERIETLEAKVTALEGA